MKSDDASQRRAYFERLYAGNPDPWDYDGCEYEIAKRADTLGFLRARYRRGVEIGCSNGVLTDQLAARCVALIGIDISETAAAAARLRVAHRPHVEIRVRHLPHDALDGLFDLVVLSEVLYFLDAAEIAAMAALAARHTAPGADLIIVSYDGETLTGLSGRAATDRFLLASAADFAVTAAAQREGYHVRLLRRRGDDGAGDGG